MTSIWNLANLTCPLCQQSLQALEDRNTPSIVRTMCCNNKHSFDIGKPGYLHLIPVQNKRSKEPGDNKEMVAARKRFLGKGYYQPISKALNLLIEEEMVTSSNILDLGCGEGYYTTELAAQITDQSLIYGLDISKAAVQQAAKRTSSIIWLVANSSKIPLSDQSVDIIFSVFSPIVPEESLRILKPNGLLITATAESSHLLALRNEIYEDVRDYDNEKLEKQLASHFTLKSAKVIHHPLTLTNSEDVLDLLHMTPHYWRTTTDKRNQLSLLSTLQTTLAVQLQVFTPNR